MGDVSFETGLFTAMQPRSAAALAQPTPDQQQPPSGYETSSSARWRQEQNVSPNVRRQDWKNQDATWPGSRDVAKTGEFSLIVEAGVVDELVEPIGQGHQPSEVSRLRPVTERQVELVAATNGLAAVAICR